jgi:hypothetical protein
VTIRSIRLVVVAVPAMIAASLPGAFAQGVGSLQPPGGLMRGAATDPNARQKLDVSLASTGGYDVNAAADPSAVGVNGQDPTGYSTLLQSALDYAFHGRTVTARANGTSAQRYFQAEGGVAPSYFRSIGHTGAVDLSVRSGRTALQINTTAAYSGSPLYALVLPVPQESEAYTPAASRDVAVSDFDSLTYGTTATLSHGLTRRSAVSIGIDWRRTDTTGSPDIHRELNTYGARAQMARRIGRTMTATAMYAYRVGDMRDSNPSMLPWRMPEHRAELAFDYRHPLSRTRRVTFSARVGASTMVVPELVPPGGARSRRDNPFSGDVSAGYEFARTWRLRAAYRQSVDYVPGLSEPVSARSVITGIDGLVSRRVDLSMSAGYSNGQSAISGGASAYETYDAAGRVRCALTRITAAYVEYVRYFYDSRGTLPLAPGVPMMLERQGVRAGVMVRLALF